MISKITCIILWMSILTATAEAYSQTKKFTFELQNVTIETVLDKIENESDFSIVYTDEVDLKPVVSISVRDKNISELLNTLFSGTILEYRIRENQVIITNRAPADAPTNIRQPVAVQQGITVTGSVSDRQGALPGASIVVRGTALGTVTDVNGSFSITVPNAEAVLQFTSVGYVTQEITVGDRRVFDVVLEESVSEIEELIVVGYGAQRKVTVVGAVSQVGNEELMRVGAVSTVSQAIQGLMPGVVAIASTDMPGASAADIFVRGRGTWQGNSAPLFLVDGVERSINDIDPNEIESISVLKDAAATAVYGVKGGNGVIIVTTKRGLNQRPNVNFSANFGFKQPTMKPEYADYITTMRMWNEAVANDNEWGQLIPESTIAAWENAFATGNYGPYNDYFPVIDWWDKMIKPWGYQQQYNLNVRGGSDFVRYFVSFGYLNDGDIFKTTKTEMYDPAYWYKRYNWRTNVDLNITKSTVLTINFAGRQAYRNQPGHRITDNVDNISNDYQENFFRAIYTGARHSFPIQWSNGEFGADDGGMGNLVVEYDRGQRTYKYYENFIDLGLKQQLDFITTGLSANAKFSYTTGSGTQSRIQRHAGVNFGSVGEHSATVRYSRIYDYSQPLPDGGYMLLEESRWPNNIFQDDRHQVAYDDILAGGYERRMKYEASLSYNRSFGNHAVSALGVFDRHQNEMLGAGSTSQLRYQEREEAWVSRLTYGYADRYLVEFSGAYTGSMRFARGLRFQFFPAYSVGWRISEEPFVKNRDILPALSELKVRYSYGVVGYDRNAAFFTYLQQYTMNQGRTVHLGMSSAATSISGPIILEGSPANESATWETAHKNNLGFDFGFFNNSLTGAVDLYKEKREGILMQMTTPLWFGYTTNPSANLGRTKTRGFEVELGWNSTLGSDFRYWVKCNFSSNENRIVYRDDAPDEYDHRKHAGKPINPQRRLVVAGQYESIDDIFNYAPNDNQALRTPGDFMYVDYNADGNVLNDDSDRPPMKHQNYPRTTYGWSVGFSWKNFSFSTMFYGTYGVFKNVDVHFLSDLREGARQNYFAYIDVAHRWTHETAATASKPPLHSVNAARQYNERASTYVYRDASYIRLKNIELSYALNRDYISKIGMTRCQFYINGNNLLTFSNFHKNVDPEGNSSSLYPLVKRFNVGVRVGF